MKFYPSNMSSDHRKHLVLVMCIFSGGLVFLDSTVVNVALPQLGDSLKLDLGGQQWVVEGYLLTLSSFLSVSYTHLTLPTNREV